MSILKETDLSFVFAVHRLDYPCFPRWSSVFPGTFRNIMLKHTVCNSILVIFNAMSAIFYTL